MVDPEEFVGNQEDIELFTCDICLTSVVVDPIQCIKCENVICEKHKNLPRCPSCRNAPFETRRLALKARQVLDRTKFECGECQEIFDYQNRLKHKCNFVECMRELETVRKEAEEINGLLVKEEIALADFMKSRKVRFSAIKVRLQVLEEQKKQIKQKNSSVKRLLKVFERQKFDLEKALKKFNETFDLVLVKFSDVQKKMASREIQPLIIYDKYSTYEGEWAGYKRDGKGILKLSNGDKYEGEFRNNKRNGKGKQVWSSGQTYEGDWVENKRTGRGVFTSPNGTFYEGSFIDDKAEGFGVRKNFNGDLYYGQFKNNQMHGKGVYVYKEGMVYSGDFCQGKLEGQGTFFDLDGSRYQGKWKESMKHGECLFTYPGKKEKVVFEKGVLKYAIPVQS